MPGGADGSKGQAAAMTAADVRAASERIAGKVHRTPVLTSRRINAWLGAEVWFKAEHLQRVGAFKFRGATNAIALLDPAARARGVVTHSSGNHAQALALAASLAGVPCTVVMPEGSTPGKVAATQGYGAEVVRCRNTQDDREATAAAIVARTGATLIHPYDDARIIAGAGTAALELLEEVPDLDTLVAPVGGGGLLAGTCLAADGRVAVWGAEPSGADDAARGLKLGRRVTAQAPRTVADGLRTCLGALNFDILQARVEGIGLADDAAILEAMREVHATMKQLIEPSSATPLAALRAGTVPRGGRIGVILSGGNADLAALYGGAA